MRKSTAVSMAIVLLALVGMMLAADMALKPMQNVLAVGEDVAAVLEARGEIRQGSKVITIARKPEARHLATSGWGMIIELEPSERVLAREGSLNRLAYRAALEAGQNYGRRNGRALEWFEIRLVLPGREEERTLILVGDDGRLGRAMPALPATILASKP